MFLVILKETMESEASIKKKCSLRLESWGWLVLHVIQTNRNGWPDTMIARNGRTVWIEFKKIGKLPRELQLYRHEEIKISGIEIFVVDKISDVDIFK